MKKNYCFWFCKTFLIVFTVVIYNNVSAQDQTVKDMLAKAMKEIKKEKIDSGKAWKTGGLFNLNLGQGSQSNWAAGGDDFSLSIASYLGFYSFYKKDKYSWDNTIDFNYGLVNTTSLGTRKNDDRIDLLSKFGYALSPKLDAAALFNFHSQFSKGYNYKSDGTKDLLSDFLAPAYLLVSFGLNYKPVKGLSIFVSPVTSRWTIVNNDTLSAKGTYGVTPGKKVKNVLGAFASMTYLTDLNKTITYNGRLDLFSNYEHNPQKVDVMMNNIFTAKLSRLLTASLSLSLIYDDDVKLFGPNHDSPALQLKSLLAAGLGVKL
ncbi:DUF3078 domain-containing protein [Ginsengibacter hankyongi]|uniref:DUF3078 domain-containing protein n=1 Tax=Ginsengibacter hankyongi TaxID=2607284 RepID=A0A5J5INJ7_9BACT|nr:DUF3078 domain-containing protein [Ginsengibacter hankyongi]KAA9041567.1 DUF3078 domain-containing protein [Ginsengibacter hankyongi]